MKYTAPYPILSYALSSLRECASVNDLVPERRGRDDPP